MFKQLDIFQVHERESNSVSQYILDKNKDRFSADCRRVFDLLMKGGKYTIKELDADRARISDLKRNGVRLSFELNKDKYKVWFMSEDDKYFNKKNGKGSPIL